MSFIINPYRFTTAGGDPYFDDVALLLHMNGANGSTTFTDSSLVGRTVTAYGNAQITTSQSKFNGSCGTFDGSGDYISTDTSSDFNLGMTNWTLEFWLRPTTAVLAQRYVVFELGGSIWGLINFPSGSQLNWQKFGTGTYIASVSGALVSGTWTYIALVKNGSTITLYQDGVSIGSTTTIPASGNYALRLGGNVIDYAAQNFNGQAAELRFTKNVARDVSTVPTAPFPDS